MNCVERQAGLQRLAAGEALPAEAAALKAHVASCESCRRDLALYSRMFPALAAMPDREPPSELYDQLMLALRPCRVALRMRRESRAAALTRRLVTAGLGLTFAIALVASLWSWLGRIMNFTGRTLSPDLVSLWSAVKDVWLIGRLLNDVAAKLGPKAEGLWSAARAVNQPVVHLAPFLFAAYSALLILGALLCWRAIHPGNEAIHPAQERRWNHVS